MRVVVPLPITDGSDVAHRVLAAEGVDHEVRMVDGYLGYGELLAELWSEGGGLVVVEHDVAPWAGALTQLADCEADWCQFRYPKDGGALVRGLGCTKFSARLMVEYPDLPSAWLGTAWQGLDGAVGTAVGEALRAEQPERFPLCRHDPPVAHARRLQ